MKKRKLALIMVLVLTLMMGLSVNTFATGSKSGVQVVSEYSSNYHGVMVLFVEVMNGNNRDVGVMLNAVATDANGKVLEYDSSNEMILMSPGECYMLTAVFPNSAKATNYDYELMVDKTIDAYDVHAAGQYIDARASYDGSGAVQVYATNTSPYKIEGRAMVVYYYQGVIADYQELYLSNNADLMLSPGEITTEYVYTDMAFDSVELFATGVR